MVNQQLSIANYAFQPEDELFLDANVWLFIFGTHNYQESKEAIYSSAFRRILEAQSSIYIDVLIVSEFINRYSRILWKQTRPPGSRLGFKAFRNSSQFEPIAGEVADKIKRVLSYCSRIESQFASLNIENLLDEYSKGGTDFNDQVFVNFCKSRNLKLVTDDGDLRNCGILVLTANENMLC